jgi:hypothetical protein
MLPVPELGHFSTATISTIHSLSTAGRSTDIYRLFNVCFRTLKVNDARRACGDDYILCLHHIILKIENQKCEVPTYIPHILPSIT